MNTADTPDHDAAPAPGPGGPAEGQQAAWARQLKHNWEARARSASRDFFVASHPGWNDPSAWAATARSSVELFLHGLADEHLARIEVLEIGCGVGRLVAPLCERVAGYTGVDISEGMLVEARRRCAGLPAARFFISDGLGVPEAAADRRYGLVLAVAVFIHCPREVIAGLLRAGYALLEPGGELRFQLRADPHDTTGLAAPEQADVVHAEMHAVEREAEQVLTAEQRALLEDVYYMGDAFGFDEAGAFVEEVTGAGRQGGQVRLVRLDLATITGSVRRPATRD